MNDPINMSTEYLAIAAAVVLVILVLVSTIVKRRPKMLNQQKYKQRWDEIQQSCANKDMWPLAVINADKLLDDALKTRKFKGKTMGERLVSAQHSLSGNDDVWFGHKMRNRLVHEEVDSLKKRDVIRALAGFRQALKDLGAL
ncbi:MAG TPA: hypothetical protein VFL85_00730 [Candidatus Saccharimonadales bacterium]|nr:hypothetical protein [Candidatus Saccharimonadales bacterium]